MKRKQWIITSVVIIILLVVGIVFLLNNQPGDPMEQVQAPSVSRLAYCGNEPARPCVVSFSVDADDNMLVNILLPELSFPAFYLKIARGENEIIYKCKQVSAALNSVYCIGEKLPPGETLHLMLVSTRDDALLAEGDLSIIGLALYVPGIAVSTSTSSPTNLPTMTKPATASPTPTQTPRPSPTPTRTKSSYPNPSYP